MDTGDAVARQSVLALFSTVATAGCLQSAFGTVDCRIDRASFDAAGVEYARTRGEKRSRSSDHWLTVEVRADPATVDEIEAQDADGSVVDDVPVENRTPAAVELGQFGEGDAVEYEVVLLADGDVVERDTVGVDCTARVRDDQDRDDALDAGQTDSRVADAP